MSNPFIDASAHSTDNSSNSLTPYIWLTAVMAAMAIGFALSAYVFAHDSRADIQFTIQQRASAETELKTRVMLLDSHVQSLTNRLEVTEKLRESSHVGR